MKKPELKKLKKTTRLFRYDLNQITHVHTVEITNKFKALDLVDRMPEDYGWRFTPKQEAITKTILNKKKGNEGKWLSEELLQIAE